MRRHLRSGIGYTSGVRFQLSELARHLDGTLVGADVEVDGAAIDSRGDIGNRLFVPLVAARDGHDFIGPAAEAGAGAYVTSLPARTDLDLPAIEVADTSDALTKLGQLARASMTGPVIGITGSVGKTSVKDLTLAACLSGGEAWASEASFNNELGVPLTLANSPGPVPADQTDKPPIVIVEMGARGVGHIAELCAVARPTIGVVTRVALAHSELFGSLEAVAQGKGELVEAVGVDGIAVLNLDDPLVAAMASRTSGQVIGYGSRSGEGSARLNVAFGSVALDGELRPSFSLETDWGRAEVRLAVRGAHMASNAAAAIAAALAAGVNFEAAVDGVQRAELSQWRMQVLTLPSGATVINDAYNANPTSMRAALAALTSSAADRRIAVVGAMAELGPEGPGEHRAIAAEATDAGVRVVAVDAPDYGNRVEHVADYQQALAAIGEPSMGDTILLKGSRVARLERIAVALTNR